MGDKPEYMVPVKRILSKAHLAAFQRSATHREIITFIEDLNASVVDKKLTEAGEPSRVSARLCEIHLTPAYQTSFGYPRFSVESGACDTAGGQQAIALRQSGLPHIVRQDRRGGFPPVYACSRLQASTALHSQIAIPPSAVPEVQVYFNEAWGNQQRIDYGSGMEFNFLCWM